MNKELEQVKEKLERLTRLEKHFTSDDIKQGQDA